MANVTFDANSSSPTQTNSVTQGTNVDHSGLTISAGLTHGALIAQVAFGTRNLTGITVIWDPAGANQALTLIGTAQTTNIRGMVGLWGLIAPTSGNKVLRVKWTGGGTSDIAVNADSWSNVDPTGGATSFPNFTSATGNSAAQSVAVTSATGDAAMEVGANEVNIYSAHGQTLTFEADSLNDIGAEGQRAAGAATVTFTATIASGGNWVAVGCSIKSDSAGASSPFVFASSDVRGRGRSLIETPSIDLLTSTLTPMVTAAPFVPASYELPKRAIYPSSLRTHAFWFNGTGEKPLYDFDATMPRAPAYPSSLRTHSQWFNDGTGLKPFYNPDYPSPRRPYRQPVGFDNEAFALRNQPAVTTPLFQFTSELPRRAVYPSELRTSIFWYVIDDNVPFRLPTGAYDLPRRAAYPPSLRDFVIGPKDNTAKPFFVPPHDTRGPYFRVRESPWPDLLITTLAPVPPPFFQRHFDLPTRQRYPNALRQHAMWFNGQGLKPFYIPDYPRPRVAYKQPVGFQYQSFAAQNVPFNPQWALNSNKIIGGVKTPPIDI